MAEPVMFPVTDSPHLFVFWCEACGYMHHVDTRRWKFNRDMVKPTVRPSLLLHPGSDHPRCHLFIQSGQISYLSDCTHAMAGKTVAMIAPP